MGNLFSESSQELLTHIHDQLSEGSAVHDEVIDELFEAYATDDTKALDGRQAMKFLGEVYDLMQYNYYSNKRKEVVVQDWMNYFDTNFSDKLDHNEFHLAVNTLLYDPTSLIFSGEDDGKNEESKDANEPFELTDDMIEKFNLAAEVADRPSGKYQTFVGGQVVSKLIRFGSVPNSQTAVAIGRAMLKKGLFYHIDHKHDFENRGLFYRFGHDDVYKGFEKIGPGFYHYRAKFINLHSNICTHMGLCKLSSGKFLLLSAADLTPGFRRQLDDLTDKGKLIEAIIATHSFHTLAFPALRKIYPDVPMYGTPRHLRKQPELNWTGNIHDAKIRNKWSPDVEIRITDKDTAGVDFVDPQPETANHVASVFVFHRQSKTLFDDDLVCYSIDPCLLFKLCGMKPNVVTFTAGLKMGYLRKETGAGAKFIGFMERMMKDWDFENLASAHQDILLGGAKEQLREAVETWRPWFEEQDRINEGKVIADASTPCKPVKKFAFFRYEQCECG